MLLGNVARRASGQSLLVAAQECGGACPRDRPGHQPVNPKRGGRIQIKRRQRHRDAPLHVPHAEHKSLPVGDGDDRAGIRPHRLAGRLGDDLLDLCLRKLFRAALCAHGRWRKGNRERSQNCSEQEICHSSVTPFYASAKLPAIHLFGVRRNGGEIHVAQRFMFVV